MCVNPTKDSKHHGEWAGAILFLNLSLNNCLDFRSIFGIEDFTLIHRINLRFEVFLSNVSFKFHCWGDQIVFLSKLFFQENKLLWLFQTVKVIVLGKLHKICSDEASQVVIVHEVFIINLACFSAVFLNSDWVHHQEGNNIIPEGVAIYPYLENPFRLNVNVL